MSPRKLSDSDKSNILNLYRNPEETTSTLAVRYGVSNSTISRILKSNLLESEYEVLIQQKRLNRTPGGASASDFEEESEQPIESETESSIESQPTWPAVEDTDVSSSTSTDQRRRRRRSSVPEKPVLKQEPIQTELPLNLRTSVPTSDVDEQEQDELRDEINQVQTSELEDLLDEDLMDLDDEDDEDDEDVDLDDDLDDDWDDEPVNFQGQGPITTSFIERGTQIQVLPLSEASLPRPCYLVVDRAAELIARPLREFSDLGRIPAEEVQEKTLPVFDNHKVARRFSNRSQRVIKVPDGRLLQKVGSHLQAKGITRLLIDGQVYSLLPTQP